jgi:hypothetical protein
MYVLGGDVYVFMREGNFTYNDFYDLGKSIERKLKQLAPHYQVDICRCSESGYDLVNTSDYYKCLRFANYQQVRRRHMEHIDEYKDKQDIIFNLDSQLNTFKGRKAIILPIITKARGKGCEWTPEELNKVREAFIENGFHVKKKYNRRHYI